MATKLTKPVSRETPVEDNYGNAGDVIVTMTASGITLRAKGKKRSLKLSWGEMSKVAALPPNAPAKYLNNPLGWLVE